MTKKVTIELNLKEIGFIINSISEAIIIANPKENRNFTFCGEKYYAPAIENLSIRLEELENSLTEKITNKKETND